MHSHLVCKLCKFKYPPSPVIKSHVCHQMCEHCILSAARRSTRPGAWRSRCQAWLCISLPCNPSHPPRNPKSDIPVWIQLNRCMTCMLLCCLLSRPYRPGSAPARPRLPFRLSSHLSCSSGSVCPEWTGLARRRAWCAGSTCRSSIPAKTRMEKGC